MTAYYADEITGFGSLEGDFYICLLSDSEITGNGTLTGTFSNSEAIGENIVGKGSVTGSFWALSARTNWGLTSHIGYLDFTKTDDGEVQDIVMPWSGTIQAIKRLGKGTVFYGDNGISLVSPIGSLWDADTVLMGVGIKGKNAVCVSPDFSTHYFIDNNGFFHILGESLQSIDFSNYFTDMSSNTVLNYDSYNNRVYISDGNYGFVWTNQGLGQGPANLTGLGYDSNTLYAAGNGNYVDIEPLKITTDIVDFGTKKSKTITSIEVGSSAESDLFVSIDYRWKPSDVWFTSPKVKTDRSGVSYHNAQGVEFRFKLQQIGYEEISIDYITVEYAAS